LREAGPLSDDERAKRLAELASRLNAIVRHLSAQGVPRSAYSALLALHAQLTEVPDTGDAFWDCVLQALEDFAGDTGSQKKLRPFWKRS
jgi:hypothetical protein